MGGTRANDGSRCRGGTGLAATQSGQIPCVIVVREDGSKFKRRIASSAGTQTPLMKNRSHHAHARARLQSSEVVKDSLTVVRWVGGGRDAETIVHDVRGVNNFFPRLARLAFLRLTLPMFSA